MVRSLFPRPPGLERPPTWVGVAVAVASVALTTGAIYLLKKIAPVVSLSVVYLPAVLLVSVYWGFLLGLATSLVSAAAFNFFHIPPIGRFTISDSRNWVALTAFVLVSAVVSGIAELARTRAVEAERRRGEADLAAGLARELLAGADTRAALRTAGHRVSAALAISSVAIELGRVESPGRLTLPLRNAGGEQLATLIVSHDLTPEAVAHLRARVVPALEALVAIALHRDAIQAEAVETAALRRSDDLKTALLRSVSHDLRSPVTAIVTAGHALAAPSLSAEDRRDLVGAVVEEGERLSSLVDKLLDLSRLQAGRALSQPDWISIEEVLIAARDALPSPARDVRVFVDPNVPPLRADPVQLHQAFSNLLENAWRYSNGLPVAIRVRATDDHVVVRIVDQGPGIPPAEQDRIFEAFYRGTPANRGTWKGSGLGLAIAKGFIEANGGTISVDSLPGQGSSFVVELPVPQREEARVR